MKISIISNAPFSVTSIGYKRDGEIEIRIESVNGSTSCTYPYTIDLGSGQSSAKPVVTLMQHAEAYLAKKGLKEKTVLTYRHMMQHLTAYGDCRLDDITTEYLQGFVTYLSQTRLKANTQRLLFQKIASVLHDADREGLFDSRVLSRVTRPKRDASKKCFLTESELKRLATVDLPEEDTNLRNMFFFSCLTGLRFGDVRRLQWKDIKACGNRLCLEFTQQKTHSHEYLPLCTEAEELLHRLKPSGASKNRMVFQYESNQHANKVLRRWSKSARIKKHITYHSSRHTFCVRLLSHNIPIFTVQKLMGHSDIRTTQVYADLMDSSKKKAVNRISDLAIFGNPQRKRA